MVLPCRVTPEARAAVEALPREERSKRVSEAIVRGLGLFAPVPCAACDGTGLVRYPDREEQCWHCGGRG